VIHITELFRVLQLVHVELTLDACEVTDAELREEVGDAGVCRELDRYVLLLLAWDVEAVVRDLVLVNVPVLEDPWR
jgi:hypothetical protein